MILCRKKIQLREIVLPYHKRTDQPFVFPQWNTIPDRQKWLTSNKCLRCRDSFDFVCIPWTSVGPSVDRAENSGGMNLVGSWEQWSGNVTFIFFVFLGTLKAADRDTHFRWSVWVSEFESSGVSIVFPHWSRGEWGVWSLRFPTETPIGSVGCINWCKNVSRQYLSMIKGRLGIVMAGCYIPDVQGRVNFYRRVKDGIFLFTEEIKRISQVKMLLEYEAMWD